MTHAIIRSIGDLAHHARPVGEWLLSWSSNSLVGWLLQWAVSQVGG